LKNKCKTNFSVKNLISSASNGSENELKVDFPFCLASKFDFQLFHSAVFVFRRINILPLFERFHFQTTFVYIPTLFDRRVFISRKTGFDIKAGADDNF